MYANVVVVKVVVVQPTLTLLYPSNTFVSSMHAYMQDLLSTCIQTKVDSFPSPERGSIRASLSRATKSPPRLCPYANFPLRLHRTRPINHPPAVLAIERELDSQPTNPSVKKYLYTRTFQYNETRTFMFPMSHRKQKGCFHRVKFSIGGTSAHQSEILS